MLATANCSGVGLVYSGLIGTVCFIGLIFSALIVFIAKNPQLKDQLFFYMILAFALAEDIVPIINFTLFLLIIFCLIGFILSNKILYNPRRGALATPLPLLTNLPLFIFKIIERGGGLMRKYQLTKNLETT